MDSEYEELIPLSALQHYAFCPRQCALIHLDRAWEENVFTLRGRRVHERVDQAEASSQAGVRIERSLPLWSNQYGLSGVADVVEFAEPGQPYPIEYKSGRRKHSFPDRIQLAGQVLCLEEMFACSIEEGALFYHKSRRRETVAIDEALRAQTVSIISTVHELLSSVVLPPAGNDARCRDCSLLDTCLPALADTLEKEELD